MDFQICAPPDVLASLEDAKQTPSGRRGYCPVCDPDHRHRDGGTLWAGIWKGKPKWCCHRCHCERDFRAARKAARLHGKAPTLDDKEKSRKIVATIEASHLSRVGDVVWRYLVQTRQLSITGPLPLDLRRTKLWHAETKRTYDVMLGVVRTPSGTAVAYHRTYLVNLGERVVKANHPDVSGFLRVKEAKKSLGSLGGNAVHLGVDADEIGVCEGIESALGLAVHTGLVCWAALSAEGMKHLVVPKHVRRVVIGPDVGDTRDTGMNAAYALRNRLRQQGVDASLLIPPGRANDWAEVG